MSRDENSRCHQDGYVCSKKPLISDRAIAAYRKAIEGTTIYKNAADYTQVFRHYNLFSVVDLIYTVHVFVKNVTRVSTELPKYTIWCSKNCYDQLITSI